ncbi:MAG: hypothetical protein ABIE94_06315 [archaeon]
MISASQFILALIIVFLGLFVGLFIAFFTKEELKPGKHHFILLQWILPFISLVFLVVFFNNYFVWAIIIIFVFLYIALFRKHRQFLYWALSIIFFISVVDKTLFWLNSLIIFIYGLSEGSLYCFENQKKSKLELFAGLFKQHYIFLVIAIVLFAINIFIAA